MTWKLACFDLDGTLARTSTGLYLARQLGHSEAMRELEDAYQAGRATNIEVATLDGLHYRGLSQTDITRMLDDIPVIRDIKKTVDWLHANGIPSVICTLAWKCVGEFFVDRYGFTTSSGPILKTDHEGVFTGEVESHFTEYDKPVFVESVCRSLGVDMSEVFHVGDSVSDIPLFEAVGFSIALNANQQAKDKATATLDSDSLFDIVGLIPGLYTESSVTN
ncbi:HAD family hydrolase [Pseudomonas yamanorum]|uniref:HAD family hydrolase n=1 Tax=Pseudomonas yamanorum TaxID=515393 RepID=UPI003F75339B